MRELAYEVFDVFTDTVFGGNPLAVIQDGRGLSDSEMQAIAREFNFSETTFVLPPLSEAGTARVRIFDPTEELPFAGHPTVGTAVSLARRGADDSADMVLELGVGPISCRARRIGGDLWEAAFTSEVPLQKFGDVPVDQVAACAGLGAEDVLTGRHAPIIASKGLPFVLAELGGQDALDRASPVAEAFRRADRLHMEGIALFALCLYLRTGPDSVAARVFAPLSKIDEDPATGSAAAALAALLCEIEARPLTIEIAQGAQMGRPSRIRAHAETPGPGQSRVEIAGSAVPVMSGTLHLPGPADA